MAFGKEHSEANYLGVGTLGIREETTLVFPGSSAFKSQLSRKPDVELRRNDQVNSGPSVRSIKNIVSLGKYHRANDRIGTKTDYLPLMPVSSFWIANKDFGSDRL